ncbi:hypothetical protein CC78DRAFT_621736 [Lojkania enalia]|uniref:Actin-like ATPase domain-containing protein n=1 Tax=Lojkania enalia TaxID=147567 RepID=A0A9P4K0P2_9PLEO|nr:hypothetical protein CC78DRAFT_621736 [Didymosphaeria enalia]
MPGPTIHARHDGVRRPYMIIAIDFGTTFSGVCWTWSGDLQHVHTVQSWDDDTDSAKVPSRIQFDGRVPIAWGFGLEESRTTFEWFKLILDYENLPLEIQSSQRVQQAHNKLAQWSGEDPTKAAVKVTARYLRMLWKHAIAVIRNQEGQTWIDGMSCKVVITRPAIWSNKASARTRKAAEWAILREQGPFASIDMQMISEPEAAAQAILQAPAVARRPDVTRPGDIYLICDAGGGTVDVISYTVRTLNPLKLDECVEGNGDLCGAIFVDDAFERDLQIKVGQQNWATLSNDERTRVLDHWERNIKRRFDPTRTLRRVIDVPEFGSFTYTHDNIAGLFHTSCTKARVLVKQQVDQILLRGTLPKAIVLVGGMGSSKYLAHLLKAEYADRIEIRHSTGFDTWSAVCRGAVMAVVEYVVVSRISRLHYGFSYDAVYDANDPEHTIDRVIWDHHEQRNLVAGKMEWVVNKGESIEHINPKRHSARQYIEFPEEIAYNRFATDIWVCDRDEAPTWKSSVGQENRPSPGVRLLCRLVSQLDRPFEALPSFVNPQNISYRVVDIDIVMFPNGNALEFAIYFQGRTLPTEVQWPDGGSSGQRVAIEVDD